MSTPVGLPRQLHGARDRCLAVAEIRTQADERPHARTLSRRRGAAADNAGLTGSHAIPIRHREDGVHPDRAHRDSTSRRRLLATSASRVAPAASSTPPPAAGHRATVVQLTAAAACRESAALTRAGAQEVDAGAPPLAPRTPARGDGRARDFAPAALLVFAQPERTYRLAETTDTPDPLQADEWWLSQIGVDGLMPPGAGVPITIVDSGLDVSHPEFAGRADTTDAERAGAGGHRRRARARPSHPSSPRR